ncbi:hypothetical protein DCAR_0313019 [Daucus carota subsp. sativus]|uniref:Uncharacterized protein n=1 Tax=Daucus carota subsp. sativus TaxID=79200 RepID=A0A166BQP7_DAUCS|nr:hypothetical protein DCAR_0313019 [Daucus carota subsp. sativus]
MALFLILRRSASRVINGGNQVHGKLIVPGASVPWLRQFCSSPCLSSEVNEFHAKRPLDESVVNNLISQVQILQRELESLRKSYGKPPGYELGQGMDESQSINKGKDDDSSERDKGDHDHSNDSQSNENDSNSSDDGRGTNDDDHSNDEALSETDGNNSDKEEDYPGSSSIVLSQEYEGELVEVTVENPTIFGESRYYGYNERKSCSFSMDLTVVVSSINSQSKKVELKCGARPNGITVYAAKDPQDGDCNAGVHMSEFNENLKVEFGKYLEARGIKLSTIDFLYKYMLDKANKERLRILENILKMVV